MAFEKAFENKYHELEQTTKYRFAELEMSLALKQLTLMFRNEFTPRRAAIRLIYKMIAPRSHQVGEWEEDFLDLANSTYFNNPPKTEMIHYLIMKGHSYNKIRDLTSASFNTISKMRYGLPHYYAVYRHWTPEMLHEWNAVKYTINIFNEPLTHTKD